MKLPCCPIASFLSNRSVILALLVFVPLGAVMVGIATGNGAAGNGGTGYGADGMGAGLSSCPSGSCPSASLTGGGSSSKSCPDNSCQSIHAALQVNSASGDACKRGCPNSAAAVMPRPILPPASTEAYRPD